MLSLSTIITLILLSHQSSKIEGQEIKSARLLDLVIRDYTFKSYTKNFRTGKLHSIPLPSNLSGIHVETVRLRCGSLRRYGATIKEFHLSAGTRVHPCTKRVLIVRQNLGPNWSSLYYDNFDLSGYALVSPVLGLLAYDVGARNGTELGIEARPVTVDFSSTDVKDMSSGLIPMCARFDGDGRVRLTKQAGANVCVATREGHFGLVVEAPVVPLRRRVSKWRMAMGGALGAALGAFLLSLVVVAVLCKAKKKKARREEMERRAYEEEALQVSMVGHVRALTASSTRTLPLIEHHDHHHRPPPHLHSSNS